MEDKLHETLNRYFNRLSQVGYVPAYETNSVLILDYITELSSTSNLTGLDKILNKALLCIQGSCLIPYYSCKETCF